MLCKRKFTRGKMTLKNTILKKSTIFKKSLHSILSFWHITFSDEFEIKHVGRINFILQVVSEKKFDNLKILEDGNILR